MGLGLGHWLKKCVRIRQNEITVPSFTLTARNRNLLNADWTCKICIAVVVVAEVEVDCAAAAACRVSSVINNNNKQTDEKECALHSLLALLVYLFSRSLSFFTHVLIHFFIAGRARVLCFYLLLWLRRQRRHWQWHFRTHTHTYTNTFRRSANLLLLCLGRRRRRRWQRGVRQTTTGALTTLTHTHARVVWRNNKACTRTHTLTQAETRCNERQQSDADAAAAAAGTWHWTLLFALLLFSFFTLLFTRLQLQICCRLFLLGFLFLAFYLIWVCFASLFYA